MKKLIFLSIMALLFIFINKNVYSGVSCVSAEQKYRIVFGNGILTSVKAAINSRQETQNLMGGSSLFGRDITYDVAYNYSDDAFGDLMQALDQKLQEEPDSFTWRNKLEIYSEVFFSGLLGRKIKEIFKKNKTYYAKKGGQELDGHILKYREAILQGDMVLVVAHSQGNLFANDAYRSLYSGESPVPANSFGIFSVATPASHVEGGGDYITNNLDSISFIPLFLYS